MQNKYQKKSVPHTYTRRRIHIPHLQGKIVPWTISTREIIPRTI